MNRFRFSICISIAMVLVATGCFGSGTTGDTWLVMAGEETLTVADVGMEWDELDEANREVFTRKDNPVGEFIVALARKHLLQQEMRAAGYLTDRALIARRDAWLRYMAVESARVYYSDLHASDVTEDDIAYFVDNMGLTVWYTLHPGTPEESVHGPEHLPEIEFTLATLLDTLDAGESGICSSGLPVRLDSLVLMDSALVASTIADSAYCREFVLSRLSIARTNRWLEGIQETLVEDYSVTVDSAALLRLTAYYADSLALQPAEVVITSDLGNWTAQDLADYLGLLSTRMYTQPFSAEWQAGFVENLLLHSVILEIFEAEAPGIIDSLGMEADAYMYDLAAELFYDDMVTSSVEMVEADVQEQFSSMSELPTMEETRVFRLTVIPPDRLPEYRQAKSSGSLDTFVESLDGYLSLCADTADVQVTRPLRIGELPAGLGTELFLAEPSDTMWIGPLATDTGTGYTLVKLLEVIPGEPATLEDIRSVVEMAARRRLEEEATVRWMQQLEESYGLQINEEALDGLPPDPGLWSDL